MGQGDVLKLLQKTRRWMLTKEIAGIIGVNPSNVLRALNQLKKEKLVEEKLYSKYHQAKLWRLV